ncbi:hypothetical protein [Corynebacterium aquilae]|uniref:hypothetical protein n=1 Tax=Corynebacterium aquilae TaxID=203263 RepID=UPI0012EE5F7F|nr:hypothetical protein [Corynebacterium aquilae]
MKSNKEKALAVAIVAIIFIQAIGSVLFDYPFWLTGIVICAAVVVFYLASHSGGDSS